MRKMHRGRVQQPRLQYLSRSLIAGACLALLGTSAVLAAAPTSFPTATTTVKVDGVPLTGLGSQDKDQQLQNTVVYDAGDGGWYYLWYPDGDKTLAKLTLARSRDGVNFQKVGTLSGAVITAWQEAWTSAGATGEPVIGYPRLQKVGDDWIMAIWYEYKSTTGAYSYNTGLWNLQASPDNLTTWKLIGPLTPAPGVSPSNPDDHLGTFGILAGPGANDTLYVRNDLTTPRSNPGAGLGRYELVGGAAEGGAQTNPDVATGLDVADLFADTDWCSHVTCGTKQKNSAYIHNYGRTLSDGGPLYTYYSVYTVAGDRAEKQLRYVTTTDATGKTGWAQPEPLFTDGSKVTVDGFPNTGNFSNPEVVPLGGGNYKSYFSTKDICGNWVMVTDAVPGTTPTMTIVKDFEPNVVAVDGESELTVTVTAPSLPCDVDTDFKFTNISYTDNLPAGVEMVSTEGEGDSNECGGTLSSTTTSFTVAGFELAAGASCTTTVTVKPTQVGSFLNTIYKDPEAGPGGLANDQGIPAAANATDTLRTPGAPMAVAPIPTLGEVSLGLLGLLMAGWGARSLRRHRD